MISLLNIIKEVDITIIGVEPKLDESEYKNSIHLIKGMSYEEYSSYMKNHDFDIGLAPLGRSSFAARKYFAKYIEYAKYGIRDYILILCLIRLQ